MEFLPPGTEFDPAILDGMTTIEIANLLRKIKAARLAESRRMIDRIFPETGPLRRELYPRHMEFFAAGRTHRERLAMCANRIGKTFAMGGYETACHLTGVYPAWWPGRRFDRPIEAWACGKSYETTRDIVQAVLLGKVISGARKSLTGTGLVYGDNIGRPTWKKGVDDLVDTVPIKHASGGWSQLGLKSYEQGRGSFEGTAKDVIWDDEEPPMDVYNEQLIRTATTNGTSMVTFTPLLGLSEVVLGFLPANGGLN